MTEYNSLEDLDIHQRYFKITMAKIIAYLIFKTSKHDEDKRKEPQLSCYNKYIPELKKHKYGSKQYHEVKQKMLDEGLQAHYDKSRHHFEHHENGIFDMTLIDIIEHWVDCKAASLKSDTSLLEGLDKNEEAYNYGKEFLAVFRNTEEIIFQKSESCNIESEEDMLHFMNKLLNLCGLQKDKKG